MVIFKSDSVDVTYNSELKCIFQKWRGFSHGDIFCEAIDRTFDSMRENNIYKIIADASEQRVVGPINQDYVKRKVLEFIHEYSKIRIAYFIEKKSRVAPSLSRFRWMIKKETGDNIMSFFNSFPDALEWIKNQ